MLTFCVTFSIEIIKKHYEQEESAGWTGTEKGNLDYPVLKVKIWQ